MVGAGRSPNILITKGKMIHCAWCACGELKALRLWRIQSYNLASSTVSITSSSSSSLRLRLRALISVSHGIHGCLCVCLFAAAAYAIQSYTIIHHLLINSSYCAAVSRIFQAIISLLLPITLQQEQANEYRIHLPPLYLPTPIQPYGRSLLLQQELPTQTFRAVLAAARWSFHGRVE